MMLFLWIYLGFVVCGFCIATVLYSDPVMVDDPHMVRTFTVLAFALPVALLVGLYLMYLDWLNERLHRKLADRLRYQNFPR
jgi:hypothetical protein